MSEMQDAVDTGDYAVMLTAHDKHWSWSVYDLEGERRAIGEDTDREAAWLSGLFAAGAMASFDRIRQRRF